MGPKPPNEKTRDSVQPGIHTRNLPRREKTSTPLLDAAQFVGVGVGDFGHRIVANSIDASRDPFWSCTCTNSWSPVGVVADAEKGYAFRGAAASCRSRRR